MLELRDIYKDYPVGDDIVRALKGISVTFRDSEFVSILGQSGCGKTTLLNILGGLDRYTTGDLVINGRSTKGFNDKDWDTYRNHSIGFVFQSYNLIMHQTVLRNVELALTISGVSRKERLRRAEEALIRVGLGDQMHKKPTQLSGGQMQRVAIARAIVNNPEIILADEPTGALDSATSVQIMEILKELSQDRLVIMVTHNPELAQQYSTRIVRLQDGHITADTMPCEPPDSFRRSQAPMTRRERRRAEKQAREASGKGKKRMSFLTALGLSFNNLRTKKGRTVLTAFAGSIGIIGIALILSLSNGTNEYISGVEEDTLSSYPVTLEAKTADFASMLTSMSSAIAADAAAEDERPVDAVLSDNIMTNMIQRMTSSSTTNDLEAFKAYIDDSDSDGARIKDLVNDIQYGYDTTICAYAADTSNGLVRTNPSTVMTSLGFEQEEGQDSTADAASGLMSDMASSMSSMGGSSVDVWKQLMDNDELLESQYDVLAGRLPEAYNEVVIITENDGTVSDYLLYALGIKDQAELSQMIQDAYAGEELDEPDVESYSYDELLDLQFKLVLPSAYYSQNEDGTWTDRSGDEEYMKSVVDAAEPLTVVGIICPNENAAIEEDNGSIGYTAELTEYVVEKNTESAIVQQQLNNPDVDVFTGIAFTPAENPTYTMDDVTAYMNTLDEATRAGMQAQIDQARAAGMGDDQIVAQFAPLLTQPTTTATYEGNLEILEVSDLDDPSRISLYAKDFESKEEITGIIDDYNDQMRDQGEDDKVIQYTDYVGLIMSSVRTVIDAISYILIAFVAISLVVSSIMIGIITYISVLERTKEIGILRAIGASKRDVSRVFNAETFVIGLFSGALGIGVTLLLLIPANIIIHSLTGISGMAQLPWIGALILIAISVVLTLVGGIIPSRMAAKRDPVTALRSE